MGRDSRSPRRRDSRSPRRRDRKSWRRRGRSRDGSRGRRRRSEGRKRRRSRSRSEDRSRKARKSEIGLPPPPKATTAALPPPPSTAVDPSTMAKLGSNVGSTTIPQPDGRLLKAVQKIAKRKEVVLEKKEEERRKKQQEALLKQKAQLKAQREKMLAQRRKQQSKKATSLTRSEVVAAVFALESSSDEEESTTGKTSNNRTNQAAGQPHRMQPARAFHHAPMHGVISSNPTQILPPQMRQPMSLHQIPPPIVASAQQTSYYSASKSTYSPTDAGGYSPSAAGGYSPTDAGDSDQDSQEEVAEEAPAAVVAAETAAETADLAKVEVNDGPESVEEEAGKVPLPDGVSEDAAREARRLADFVRTNGMGFQKVLRDRNPSMFAFLDDPTSATHQFYLTLLERSEKTSIPPKVSPHNYGLSPSLNSSEGRRSPASSEPEQSSTTKGKEAVLDKAFIVPTETSAAPGSEDTISMPSYIPPPASYIPPPPIVPRRRAYRPQPSPPGVDIPLSRDLARVKSLSRSPYPPRRKMRGVQRIGQSGQPEFSRKHPQPGRSPQSLRHALSITTTTTCGNPRRRIVEDAKASGVSAGPQSSPLSRKPHPGYERRRQPVPPGSSDVSHGNNNSGGRRAERRSEEMVASVELRSNPRNSHQKSQPKEIPSPAIYRTPCKDPKRNGDKIGNDSLPRRHHQTDQVGKKGRQANLSQKEVQVDRLVVSRQLDGGRRVVVEQRSSQDRRVSAKTGPAEFRGRDGPPRYRDGDSGGRHGRIEGDDSNSPHAQGGRRRAIEGGRHSGTKSTGRRENFSEPGPSGGDRISSSRYSGEFSKQRDVQGRSRHSLKNKQQRLDGHSRLETQPRQRSHGRDDSRYRRPTDRWQGGTSWREREDRDAASPRGGLGSRDEDSGQGERMGGRYSLDTRQARWRPSSNDRNSSRSPVRRRGFRSQQRWMSQ